MPTSGGKKSEGASGRISFRLPPQVHSQLLDIANDLGLDLSSLINMMLKSSLPRFLGLAKELGDSGER
jgi:predicted HicB family RNase H-like nuclease